MRIAERLKADLRPAALAPAEPVAPAGGPAKPAAEEPGKLIAEKILQGFTNRSEVSLRLDEQYGSAPPSARSVPRATPRSDGRPTPRSECRPTPREATLPRERLQLSRSVTILDHKDVGTPPRPGPAAARVSLSEDARENMAKENMAFARVKSRFTPEQRARQRAMMAEVRNRVEVRKVDMHAAFRELDEDKSGAGVAHIELPQSEAELLFAFGDTNGDGE
ncbi:hypothetical protein T492DRAFT_864409, partial [Pavlovales sp. CCMP2436]